MASLELCAERAGDIVPQVFARFFAADADAHALMQHSDEHMQGRMFEGVLELFMSDDHFGPGKYLQWEIENHIDAYAATAKMYESFFASLVAEVQDALAADWNEDTAGAWQNRIERIMKQVNAHHSK